MTHPVFYDFEVDRDRQLIDGRTVQEIARFIDDHGKGLSDYESEFLDRVLRERLEHLSPQQFALMCRIYDEKV